MSRSREHGERLADLRNRMKLAGFDHLVVPAPENMYYLSGFDSWSFYLHQCLIVSRHHERVLWVGRASDLGVAQACDIIDPDAAFCYPDSFLQSDECHPYDFVAARMLETGRDSGRIGAPLDAYYFSPAALSALRCGLRSATVVGDGNIVNWQRVIKSETEIALMREAGRIVSAAMHAGVSAARPGATSASVAAEILRVQTGVTIGADGGYPGIQPLIIDGVGPAQPHHTWSDRRLGTSGPLVIEIAGSHKRYHAPIARTVFLSTPTDRQRQAMDAQQACMELFTRIAHDGAIAGLVADQLASELRRHGFVKAGRFGYSTGIAYPPDWGEHTLSIRSGDRKELKAGMTIFLIPALWGGEWTVALGEPFVIREKGAERLTNFGFEIQ